MWQLRIQDPSGETRIVPIQGEILSSIRLGRGEQSDVILRDPTVSSEAALIYAKSSPSGPQRISESPYWIKAHEGSHAFGIAGVMALETQIPLGLPVKLGETKIVLERRSSENTIPPSPSGVRPWLTTCEEGRKTLWMAKKAAATPLSIYLAGETGTGKEVLAHLLHAWSDRASGSFVPLHCGALPASLAESELFGHVKGAFTGAIQHRPGALMQAHGGTLFLDEVGDLTPDIQVKLLRFLENGEIRPVGADRPSKADARVLCATHLPLRQLVEQGKFRRDLYYRLASVTIDIPPLRQRIDDIEMLSNRFAGELSRSLSSQAMLRLKAHSWPGNVRELRHAIERASGLSGPFTSTLTEEAFEFLLTPEHVSETPELQLGAAVLTLDEMERVLLLKALKLAKGNRANAAKILGVARSTLFEMLKRHRVCGPKSIITNSAVA